MRSRRLLLAAILVFCVVGRGAYAIYLVHTDAIVTERGDTPTYLGPARELAEHGRFDRPGQPDEPRHPEFIRTPGYPVFVAAVYRVFGVGDNTAVLLAQVLLSGGTVLLAYLLATRMWSSTVGLLAALFTTLEPLQSSTSATLLTETLSAFVLLVLAIVGYETLRDDTPRAAHWALLGSVLAVATLVRPIAYYLPLLVLVFLVARYARRVAWRDVVKVAVAFVVPIVVLIGGWQVRNHERVDSWRLSGIEARNLYLYRAAGVVADRSDLTLEEAQAQLRDEFGPRGTEREGPYYDRMYDEGVRIIRDHPIPAITDSVRGLGSELFGVRSKFFVYLKVHPVPAAAFGIALAGLLAFYAACAYGIALVIRARRHLFAHAFVLGIAAYVLIVSAGPEAFGGRGERFRAPIMPILMLYAAFGVYAGWHALERERSRRRVRQASSA